MENLEFYIRDRTQRLVNQRALKDDAHIDYTLGEAEEDGKVPVDLLVTVNDSGNIIAFPKPVWDDNTGFDITLKARDYNFFGTMNPLRVDFGYAINRQKESSFNILIDSDIPFTALGYNWNINFDNEFDYTSGEHLRYTNTTGISMELPVKTTTFNFNLEHFIRVNPQNGDRQEAAYGKYFEGVLNSVVFSASWTIPTGLKVGGYGELTYTPRISESISYNPGNRDSRTFADLYRGPTTGLSHSLGFGRVDWIGNFRRGLDVSFKNSNTINHNPNTWNVNYSSNATGHFIFTGFFGTTARIQLRQWFLNYPDKVAYGLGDRLRGILDDNIKGTLMLSLNLEFPFKVFDARPEDWFKTSKMRYFNFEIFVSPILDIGMVYLPDNVNDHTTNQDTLSMYYTAGIEAFIFPEFWRSLYIRVSAGIDLGKWAKSGSFPSPEWFIGLGHFF
jgi:hypothetical protein